MKTTAFIPIKLNNERLPCKNLKPFSDGTPLVHFVQKALLRVAGVDEIYVFCSDDAILPYILDGVRYLRRPATLDTKETLSGDIMEVFTSMVDADIFLLAHATSPFIMAATYAACLEAVQSGRHSSAFAAKKLQNFLWYQGRPLNFTLDKAPRTQDMEPAFCELSSPYVFTREVFRKYHGRTGDNPYIHECSEIEAIDIDYPEDFLLADTVYMNLLKGRRL